MSLQPHCKYQYVIINSKHPHVDCKACMHICCLNMVSKSNSTDQDYPTWTSCICNESSLNAIAPAISREENLQVGRDSRLSGPLLLASIVACLASQGVSVAQFGLATTPSMFMSCIIPGMHSQPMHILPCCVGWNLQASFKPTTQHFTYTPVFAPDILAHICPGTAHASCHTST